jgi:hypothetical protein
MGISNLVGLAILITTAAALPTVGITEVSTATQAALALQLSGASSLLHFLLSA